MVYCSRKYNTLDEFVEETEALILDLGYMKKNLEQTLHGNNKAARRVRVATLEFEKKAKSFRKNSIEHTRVLKLIGRN